MERSKLHTAPALAVLLFLLVIITFPTTILATNSSSTKEDEDDHRYIVKFKEGSTLYGQRLHRYRKLMSTTLEDASSSDIRDVKFLEPDNAEVMILMTDKELEAMENNDEVEYVEKGKKKKKTQSWWGDLVLHACYNV